MSTLPGQPLVPDAPRVVIDNGRYWSGAAATTVVAALAAVLAVVVIDEVLDYRLLLPFGDSPLSTYLLAAVLAAVVAAILLYGLALSTPRPLVFFGWIVTLVTLTFMALPFSRVTSWESKISTACVVALIGIIIGTTLTAVAHRTVKVRIDPAPTPPGPPAPRPPSY